MMNTIINILLQGIMLGGLYALFALGLSLSVGVIKLVNIAHGDLIILISFALFYLTQILGACHCCLLSFLSVLPLAFAMGYAMRIGLLSRVMDKGQLAPLLVTFGLSVIIQNMLLEGFGADTRSVPGGDLQVTALQISDKIFIGALPALTLCAACSAYRGDRFTGIPDFVWCASAGSGGQCAYCKIDRLASQSYLRDSSRHCWSDDLRGSIVSRASYEF